MKRSDLSLLASLAGATCAHADVSFVEQVLELDGKLLDQRFVDWDGDGTSSLCLAVRLPGGRRELRFHDFKGARLETEPTKVVSVLEDVTAYGFAEVRPTAGRELLFLTRTGAWSYSLTLEGYRDNIERLVEEPLFFDVPDDGSLPFWEYVLPAPGGDQLLLPGLERVAVWEPMEEPPEDPRAARYLLQTDLSAKGAPRASSESGATSIRVGVNMPGGGFFLEDRDHDSNMVENSKSLDAPALIDVDGDGALDLVRLRRESLEVFLRREGTLPSAPTRVEAFPEYLLGPNDDVGIYIGDFDGDGRDDLYALVEGDIEGIENGEKRLLFLRNDGERLFPEAPAQVLRFSAVYLEAELVDADGDGRPELAVREVILPSGLELATGLQVSIVNLLYLSRDGDAPFERKPAFKDETVFDENNAGDALKNGVFELDCSGDGMPDLVEVDLQGRTVIRRLRFDSGFFSGDTWELEDEPWKRFDSLDAQAFEVSVVDANGDGVGDVVRPGTRSLTLYLSRRSR